MKLGWILILALVCSSAFGQRDFGIKAGLNLAALRAGVTIPGQGSGSATTNTRTSVCAGMYFRRKLSATTSFQSEILYSSQGGGSTNGSPEFKIDYMLFPLMFLFHVDKMVSIQAGPQLGFLLSAQAGGQSVTKEMNPLDVALNFGIGFEFAGGVDVSFRYMLGLTNAASNANTSNYPAGTSLVMNNQVAQIALGYKLSKR